MPKSKKVFAIISMPCVQGKLPGADSNLTSESSVKKAAICEETKDLPLRPKPVKATMYKGAGNWMRIA